MTKKEAILQTATFLFAQKGYKETAIAELSKITGVAEGTIFYHFKNKETLFIAVLEKTREVILQEYEQFVKERSVKTGMELMENSIYFYLYLSGKYESQLLLLHRHSPYQLALDNTDCRNHLEAIYDCLVNIFERAVLEGIKDGSMDELPARKMALIIFSMMDGIVRLKIYNLYNVSSLMNDIILSCRRLLKTGVNP